MTDDDNNDKTVFRPSPLSSPTTGRKDVQSPFDLGNNKKAAPPQPEPDPKPVTSFTPLTPREGGIQVGDVLNHMFEVKRFIARGGMGEVFEGTNIASEERVAIKVMLPQLAADPNVQAMFKKEARTLTRLSHPALVQYRTIAQEPQLGVLFIVTEYVDSKNLEDALASLKATPAQLLALTRRLADGLRAAHSLGAIHRDISPDNVLLEDGELAKARIIDFGIAKDLDPSSKTIVGDGFAGKLNFVAPEQLGDFNREVGPWTDVYSLALVILAVARGRPVNMGGTLVDAVDKRRAGPDLSDAPEELRLLLSAMLTPNPELRLRSMDEVIAFIDNGPALAPPAAPATNVKPKSAPKPASVTGDAPKVDPKLLMYGGGGAALLLVLIVGGVILFSGKPSVKPKPQGPAPAATGNPVVEARAAITSALPAMDCAWLDIGSLSGDGSGVTVSVKGVARDTLAVQKVISDAVASKNLTLKGLDTNDVAPLSRQNACPMLNAYAAIKGGDTSALSSPQVKYEMTLPEGKTAPSASPIIDFRVDPGTPDLALYGIQPTGEGLPLIENLRQLADPAFRSDWGITERGNGQYEMKLGQDETGWAGLLLLTGKGPFPPSVIIPPPSNRGVAWRQDFDRTAAANGWKSEMIWIDTVDDVPNR